ncbi:MAG: hypothetical protein L0229_19735 [Blastocatellia bacterium]|nr:hypothetical protein [Blastocatellia bacterium]
MKQFYLWRLLISVCLILLLSADRDYAAIQLTNSQTAFFESIKKLCGQSFEGATEFPQNPDHPLAGKKLVITVGACTDKEIRILFHVGEDKSRTWILTLSDKGLLFKHDHRHADGTPDEITMYGGWASPEGTAYRQRFLADSETKKLIPEAATNVWMLEIDKEKEQLVYYLERHDEPRYRAVFNLKPINK